MADFGAILVCMAFVMNLLHYMFFIPGREQKPLTFSALDKYLGVVAYVVAYVLSLLRAPLGLCPYLVKLVIFFGLKVRYESARSTYFREVLNMLGDILNLGASALCVFLIVGKPTITLPALILYLPVWAECVRLLTERPPIIYSAAWQLMPHRCVARLLLARRQSGSLWWVVARCLGRYCRYYALADAERAAYVLETLKQRAREDDDLTISRAGLNICVRFASCPWNMGCVVAECEMSRAAKYGSMPPGPMIPGCLLVWPSGAPPGRLTRATCGALPPI
ncbi:MAG: hypothetical protein ABI456_04555 [Ktedonobacteraceae bacterium]|nr:hypothetical protein [Chloroflexota bacterium]